MQHLKKIESSKRNIDQYSKYYINLSTDTPDGVGQCIIPVNNVRYNITFFINLIKKKFYFNLLIKYNKF